MAFSATIQEWFDTYWGGAIYLPDGWYGRPWDGQCSLTSITETQDELFLVLDEVISLRFANLEAIEASATGLTFSGFKRFEFRVQSQPPPGGRVIRATDYETGPVSILISPG